MKAAIIVAAFAAVVGQTLLMAQGGVPPVQSAHGDLKLLKAARENKTVPQLWMWHMGILRGVWEIDGVATLELQKSTGAIRVGGQPCALINYRASINYQVGGMRVQYACTGADGQMRKAIEVVSGQFAWDEDIVGAELVPGKGTATPKRAALNERLIRLWSSPQGAPKAAVAGGANTKVTVEGGKKVLTYPIPGVSGAVAKATLNAGTGDGPCAKNCAERIEVRQGNVLTEFIYSDYEDYNDPLNKIDAFFPGHMVEKRDGVIVLDLTTVQTETGNLYVIMPVPARVRMAGATQP